MIPVTIVIVIMMKTIMIKIPLLLIRMIMILIASIMTLIKVIIIMITVKVIMVMMIMSIRREVRVIPIPIPCSNILAPRRSKHSRQQSHALLPGILGFSQGSLMGTSSRGPPLFGRVDIQASRFEKFCFLSMAIVLVFFWKSTLHNLLHGGVVIY